ncbi:NAD(P)/FAD-dependent oxidoreductase [Nocardioides astragali]|uniref:NAD(P)/FAD-dependent oxidoreductase n=1 Tax=Nocardioides astragali TaxID=1776736 RepID=A0ABW2N0W6_9ACTN|nr:FAD-binding oxidoreductase [Nocardioides astragali]
MSNSSSTVNEAAAPASAIIVGAGILGAATALFLAREGVAVRIVERQHAGWGASGRNAGYISMITRSGGPQLELANLSRSLYSQLAEELDDFEFQPNGALVYYYEEQLPLIEGFVKKRQEDGLPMEIVSGDRARELCPLLPEDVVGGIHSKSDCYLHPGKLVDALMNAAIKLGAELIDADVTELVVEDGRCVGVRTARTDIRADVVAVTAGSWTAAILEKAGLPFNVLHMRMQMAETAPIEERFNVAAYGPSLFHEYAFVRELPGYDDDIVLHPLQHIMPEVGLLELICQRADGRLWLGCPIEFVDGPDASPDPTVAGMAQTFGVLGDHVPALQHIPVERTWGGIAPQTGDGLPVMSDVPSVPGLFVGSGHAYGATVGPGSARVLADIILGRVPGLDASPFRYDRPAITEGMARSVSLG